MTEQEFINWRAMRKAKKAEKREQRKIKAAAFWKLYFIYSIVKEIAKEK